MKFCVIVPCYNHAASLDNVLASLPKDIDVIVVDDGSAIPLCVDDNDVFILRHTRNMGKAAALKSGFVKASELGATHVITIDADGQHPTSYISTMIEESKKNPENIIVAVRDFENSSIPPARKFLNKFSNFWFKVETKKIVNDTQCGFRCYPLLLLNKLDLRLEGFVFEVELLVKASWAGCEFSEIKIPAIYSDENLKKSHYRPVLDTIRFTMMNTRLFFQSLLFPKKFLRKIALKK